MKMIPILLHLDRRNKRQNIVTSPTGFPSTATVFRRAELRPLHKSWRNWNASPSCQLLKEPKSPTELRADTRWIEIIELCPMYTITIIAGPIWWNHMESGRGPSVATQQTGTLTQRIWLAKICVGRWPSLMQPRKRQCTVKWIQRADT